MRRNRFLLRLSAEQVRLAGLRFCRQYQTHGGDELWQLWHEIQTDRTATNDPACWYDWLDCVWAEAGLLVPEWVISGDTGGAMTDRAGNKIRVEIHSLENSRFSEQPEYNAESGAFTELKGFRVFRNFIDRVYESNETSIGSVERALTIMDSPVTVATWSASLASGRLLACIPEVATRPLFPGWFGAVRRAWFR